MSHPLKIPLYRKLTTLF
jgi:solute carrier family 25 (adenine nucleotide translocator) protein 4/5/6/31